MGATTREQTSFRIRNDDGSESAATWRQAINIDDTLLVDTNYRIRFGYTIGGMDGSVTCQLEYNLASAGWNNVDATSSVVQSVASPNVADNATITEQLDQGKTFTANTSPTGGFDEVDGLVSSQDLTLTEECEVEFCFQILSGDVADEQILQLKITQAGTDFDTYTETPTITVSESSDTTDVEFAGTRVVTPQPQFIAAAILAAGLTFVPTVVPLDWMVGLSEPISIAQYQYKAQVEPLEPIAAAAAPDFGWYVQAVDQLLRSGPDAAYQRAHFGSLEPVDDRDLIGWFTALSEPPLPLPGLLAASQQAYFASLQPITDRDLIGWFVQETYYRETGSPLPFLTAGAQPTGAHRIETEFVDEWWRPLSEPTPPQSGLHVSLQQAYVADANMAEAPDSGAEVITVDKWHRPLSEPVPPIPGLDISQQQEHSGSLEPLTPRDLIGWYVPLAEPPAAKPGLHASLQQAHTGSLEPLTDRDLIGWFTALSEPVRLTPRLDTASQQAHFGSLEPLVGRDLIGWFAALSEPSPPKPGLDVSGQRAFFSGFEPIVAAVVPDFGWNMALSGPVLPVSSFAALGTSGGLFQGEPVDFVITEAAGTRRQRQIKSLIRSRRRRR